MPVLASDINPHSAEFADNSQAMQKAIDEFRQVEQKVLDKAQAAKTKFVKRGKLLPRERLNLLLDPGSDFIELASLAGYQQHGDQDGSMAGGGIIAGIGMISQVRCLIYVNNAAIKGGTISPTGLDKTLRLQEIALENKLPLVSLAESGGANLHHATEVFVAGARAFANQARLSAAGIPQITVCFGNATAGGAYQTGLSDILIAVRGKASMFLAGPPLLKAATGEIASDEELGGAQMHAEESGCVDYLAEDDSDAIRISREVIAALPWNEQLPFNPTKTYAEPEFSPDELIGVVPSDAKTPYDVREVICRLVDGSHFRDFKEAFDNQTPCGFAHIGGHAVGIIGNNGPITPAGANKAAQFIQFCNQNFISLLFLHNTTGFMVGTDAEKNGIIKHGSKMLQAVANATVPKYSLVIGGSYGAGNYAMCGRGLDPRFIFAWPNSRTAVMGGKQAGQVLRIVAEEKQRKMGIEPDQGELDKLEQGTAAMLEAGSTALFGTSHLWDDGLIDPRDSRRLMIHLLELESQARHRQLQTNSFGVPRF